MLFGLKRNCADPGKNYLVVGLGNIGAEYADTRHNMGFMILDAWTQASNICFDSKRYGDMAELSWKGRRLYLLKPSTYMNLSGNAVRFWLQKLGIPVENLIVICDDLNIPFGTLRMRKNGSDGGHNGLKNIQECLETSEYTRIRVGIGNNFRSGEQIDFVLGSITDEQKAAMPELSDRVIEGVKNFCTIGPDRAMNYLNTRPKPKPADESEKK